MSTPLFYQLFMFKNFLNFLNWCHFCYAHVYFFQLF